MYKRGEGDGVLPAYLILQSLRSNDRSREVLHVMARNRFKIEFKTGSGD